MKHRLSRIVIVAVALAAAVSAHAAAKEKFLYKFSDKSSTNPAFPQSNLVIDKAGNMYGTTYDGGTHNQGTVFELSPESGGGWTFSVIYNFGTVPNDGAFPYGPLTIDSAGNLYGITFSGPNFSGVVFELSPDGSGGWTETTPYVSTFSTVPSFPIVVDSSGNLYGTASNENGGVGYAGLVYELTPSAGGWTFQDIFDFNSDDTGGFGPFGLVLDSAGNLYGTTVEGGESNAECKQGCGVVFELTQSAGIWSEQVLLDFNNSNGARPYSLTLDASGNLYGNAALGGPKGYGVVYKLSQSGGVWTQTILHAFSNTNGDGAYPETPLLVVNGNVYGTTMFGGGSTSCEDGFGGGCGTTFQLSLSGTTWKENILHSFEPENGDGSLPYGIATDGTHLYGVTQDGGSTSVNAAGTVYELSAQ